MLTFNPTVNLRIGDRVVDQRQGIVMICRGCQNGFTRDPSGLCASCRYERAWGRRCGRCGTYLGPTGRRRCACDRRNNRGVIA
jgi:predicted amidophosphoribosyltransferase